LILTDVNVLIYAFRVDSKDHALYKAWLEEVVNGPSAYGVSPQVLASVVRVCSHPKIFVQPSGIDELLKYCDALVTQPNARIVAPGDRHWPIFGKLCVDAKATGNLVQDAWNAALAIEAGCEWITTDRDYARFQGLNWRSPF
jgi:toxin-antitoxin system PIN domain toxin